MLDVVLSLLALMVLSPLLLAIGLLVAVDDPRGSPIFRQERVGKGGRRFWMYKFRTMCVDAETRLEELSLYNEMSGPTFKMREDPRITRVGRILRRTSLDELPQLVNVLRGEMSLVGPRPPLPREVAQYTPYEWQRLSITPGRTSARTGMSCLWTSGWRWTSCTYRIGVSAWIGS